MADALKADVTYLGQNGVKQHLFGNGTALVTHVFATLPEAIERFGSRIKIDDRPYKMSLNFKQGYASATYSPRPNADRVERMEYTFGHLKRLLERDAAKKAAQPVKPVDMRLPHEVLADKTKAEKVASNPAPTKAAMSQGIAAIAKRRGKPAAAKPTEMEIGDEGV